MRLVDLSSCKEHSEHTGGGLILRAFVDLMDAKRGLAHRLQNIFLLCFLMGCSKSPTWYQDIAPIIERSCSGCHNWNEYSAPPRAQDMLSMIREKKMPPWLPGPNSLPFSNDPRLKPDEIELFAKWAMNPQIGFRPTNPLPVNGTTSAVFESEPYLPKIYASDEIHCFLLRPRSGFVKGYKWVGVAAHHYFASVISKEHVPLALSKERVEGQGWDCKDAQVDIPTKATLISTTPFSPFEYPSGYGLELKEGDAMIIYVHLLPPQIHQPVRFGISLTYSELPLKPVVQAEWNTPAELPCPPSMATEPQCQREYAVKRAILGIGLPDPAEHILHCEPQIFGPESNGLFPVRGACTEKLPPGRWRLIGVRVHTHLLGRSARVLVQRPNGEWLTALDIPAWDYRYELTASPLEEIEVSGSIRIECNWDNGPASQTERPSYRIFGLGRDDNMCVGSVSLGEI